MITFLAKHKLDPLYQCCGVLRPEPIFGLKTDEPRVQPMARVS
jgi:hypothetical protein